MQRNKDCGYENEQYSELTKRQNNKKIEENKKKNVFLLKRNGFYILFIMLRESLFTN